MDDVENSRDDGDIKSLWAAIADREARLLTLIEASAEIVWVTDKDGNVLTGADPPQDIAHLTWSSFTGLGQESLHGRGWAAAVHPDDIPVVASVTRKAKLSDSPIDCEFRLKHKSGEWRWMVCRGTPITVGAGGTIGWIGTCSDITRGKKTEEALREAQQRLLAALEAGQMSTWIWRLADNTFWWDRSGETLWGVPHGSLASHRMEDLIVHIHPDDRAEIQRTAEHTVKTGEARGAEFRTLRPDGKLQWLSSRGRVEKDESGKPVRVVGAFVDITKLKLAEASLRHAQKMQALGTLAGGIAHDFNNLLLSIAGNAQLALGDTGASHGTRTAVEEISKASARASDLVKRILAFSTSAPRATASTPLVSGVQEALNLARVSVPQNISIRTQFDASSAGVPLDATELQQVVINLITNAVHAIGDARGTIDVSIAIRGENSRLVVRDSGCGMNSATVARVFDPFFTTKLAGQGTGLGLAVVHGIVQGARGSIEIDSQLGAGSKFAVNLPVVDHAIVADSAIDKSGYAGHGERILYVDDDEAVVFLVERALRQLGYAVSGFTDPAAAIRAFTDDVHAFDVVVTDLSMPGLTGFDVARAVKAARSSTPIVLTSGYVRDHEREQAAAVGIDHVILKPNTIEELGRLLSELCRELQSS